MGEEKAMQKMKAAKYYGSSDIRVEEVPVPETRKGEMKFKVEACGICGSDITGWYMDPEAPKYFGHEPAGTVVEIGEGVENVNIGDRVFVHHHVPCFVCHYCQRGNFTMCETFKNTNIHPAGFAEYIRVPALNLERDTLKLPDSVTFEEATMIEPIGCCIKGLKKANPRLGDTVAVVGAGFAGAVHIQLARIFGAAKIIAIDSVEYRLKKALEFGADAAINFIQDDVLSGVKDFSDGRGADIVIVASGSFEAIKEGVQIAAKGSTLYLFAPFPPGSSFPIDLNHFFFSEITFVTSYSSTHLDTHAALELIANKRIDSKNLITHRFPLNQINEAMQLALKAKESLKVVVTMSE
jgi:L-iditol 2-dehydrogenase